MKNYLFIKYLRTPYKEYFFIFLAVIIFSFISFTKSFGEENVFTINNVKVEGPIDINFSRHKYIDIAFEHSFQILMKKILLTRDLEKIKHYKLSQIKRLIRNFQISGESFKGDLYKANIKISYSEDRIKEFLGKKNISFSQPEDISAVFFPVLFIKNEMQNFNENFFYTRWNEIKIENELINFILPLDDLEDISKITNAKNKIEELEVESLVNKYDEKNYIFGLMDYNYGKLNIYLKINFNNNKISKNFLYKIKDIKNQTKLEEILKDLKLKITDLWKEENLVNVLLPLSIKLKFQHKSLANLNKLRDTFNKIRIVDNYTLEEFSTNFSYFKIYYFGNPKKLKSELLQFGYQLKNNQGLWQLYLNE